MCEITRASCSWTLIKEGLTATNLTHFVLETSMKSSQQLCFCPSLEVWICQFGQTLPGVAAPLPLLFHRIWGVRVCRLEAAGGGGLPHP